MTASGFSFKECITYLTAVYKCASIKAKEKGEKAKKSRWLA